MDENRSENQKRAPPLVLATYVTLVEVEVPMPDCTVTALPVLKIKSLKSKEASFIQPKSSRIGGKSIMYEAIEQVRKTQEKK